MTNSSRRDEDIRNSGDSRAGRTVADRYVTMVFDSEDDYVRFTDRVYEQFGADALDFTDTPLLTSVRVRRDVLKQVRDSFAMHELGEQDQALIDAQPKPQKWPFDATLICQTPIPGVPDALPTERP